MNEEAKRLTAIRSTINRRDFMTVAAVGLVSATASAKSLMHLAYPRTKIKAIAFDAFPIFDPRPVFAMVTEMYPEKGNELSEIWRTKQFEYMWLRTVGNTYKDFWTVTEDALSFAAQKTGVDITTSNKKKLMDKYMALNVWPDVIPALETLKQKSIKLIFLSNMTEKMLRSCSSNAKIEGYFDHIISTDSIQTYKPDPRAYQLGIDTLKFKKEEIAFAAFAGWDAAGAKWFGYPTFWVNRQGAPAEELGTTPDGIGKGMADLLQFVLQ